MKNSIYTYFFDTDKEYIGYTWLTNSFVSYNISEKDKVMRLIAHPEEIVTNQDTRIYSDLTDKLFLIPDGFNEYNYLLKLRRQVVHRTDKMQLTICPTMSCNLRCTYCYESHPSIKDSKIDNHMENLKRLVESKIKSLNELSIAWFGGEPLALHNVVVKFSKFCKELCKEHNVSFKNSMSTNFVLANDKIIKDLTDNNLNFIQVTIDGYKENHDQKRVTKNNIGTFDILVNNINKFLNYSPRNRIALRMHFPANLDKEYINNTIESLEKSYDPKIRNRITVYQHLLFESRTDSWKIDNKNRENYPTTKAEEITISLDGFRKKVFAMGFNTSLYSRKLYYCEADLDYFWTVRPDGFLSKCTIAIEKERAQAMLNENGIKRLSNNVLDFNLKDNSSVVLEYCKDCKYLPLCWYGCGFSISQSDDFEKEFDNFCLKKNGTWMFNRLLEDIKYLYVEKKRNKNESRHLCESDN